ncbi:MAG: glycosyltransferase, partial [Terracidiphilus sp.]
MIRGGAQRQLLELLRGLDRREFDPTLILFNEKDQGGQYDVGSAVDRLLSLNIPPGGNFRARNVPSLAMGLMRLTKILRTIRPHVVHAFLPAPSVIGSVACRLAGVPAFIVGRRIMAGFHRRDSKLLASIDRLSLRSASGLIANCEAIAQEAVALDGLAPERAFAIYNGVDTKVFYPGTEEDLRRDLGFAADDIVFGVMANFHYRKRHIDFILAAEQIRKSAAQAKFLMVGSDDGMLA